jgi:hypothetical protein
LPLCHLRLRLREKRRWSIVHDKKATTQKKIHL